MYGFKQNYLKIKKKAWEIKLFLQFYRQKKKLSYIMSYESCLF